MLQNENRYRITSPHLLNIPLQDQERFQLNFKGENIFWLLVVTIHLNKQKIQLMKVTGKKIFRRNQE